MTRLTMIIIATAATAIGAFSLTAPAHAATMHPSAPQIHRTIPAGCFNTPNQATLAMHSSPHPNTYYVGTAHQGDCLSDFCWTVGSDGAAWDLVLDHNGAAGNHFSETAAFIPEYDLESTAESTYCDNLVIGNLPGGPYVNGVKFNATMLSAPISGTYVVGTATPGHPFIDVCEDTLGGGNFFHLVLDEQGVAGNRFAYTAAFISDTALDQTVPITNGMEETCS